MGNDDGKIMTTPEKTEHILNGICRYFGVSREELMSKPCIRTNFDIRRYAVLLLYDYTASSHRHIAKALGYKKHGAVLFHYKNMKDEIGGALYGSEKTKMVYHELLTFLNLKTNETKAINYEQKAGE